MTLAERFDIDETAIGLAVEVLRQQSLVDDNDRDRVAMCAKSVREFAKYAWLNDPERGEIPFAMWDWQTGLLELWDEERLSCTLKARQLGVSWLVAVFVLWRAMFRKGQRILLISIGQLEADKLLEKVKFILDHLPDWLRPPDHHIDAKVQSLRFPLMDSEIESLPSTGRVGRSRSASLVVLDEHAWQANDRAIWTAIKATVEHGTLISISTANGLGALHTRIYKGAKAGKTNFVPIFIPWDAHPERDANWYETERSDYEMAGQPDEFAQEYPSNDEEAFIVTGNPVWKAEHIVKQPEESVAPIEPGLWIYREPEPDAMYAIGVDTAEGTGGGDWCSACVLRVSKEENDDDLPKYSGEQVAQLRGRWEPEVFAEKIDALARRYAVGFRPRYARPVLVGVERNNHGHAVLLKLRQLNASDEPYAVTSWGGKLGWLTNKQTRPIMFDELAGAIRGNAVVFHDPGTISEMTTFSQTKGGGEAQSGYHDDDLTAAAIGWQHHRRAFGVTIKMPRRGKT